MNTEEILATLSEIQQLELTKAMMLQSIEFTKQRLLKLSEEEMIAAIKSEEFVEETKRAWAAIFDDRLIKWLEDNKVVPDKYKHLCGSNVFPLWRSGVCVEFKAADMNHLILDEKQYFGNDSLIAFSLPSGAGKTLEKEQGLVRPTHPLDNGYRTNKKIKVQPFYQCGRDGKPKRW